LAFILGMFLKLYMLHSSLMRCKRRNLGCVQVKMLSRLCICFHWRNYRDTSGLLSVRCKLWHIIVVGR